MATTVSSADLLEDAICILTGRWLVSPQEASTAISEVAAELDLEVIDMAALVAASEQQQRLQKRSWNLRSGTATTGWALRHPTS
jgi:hypothetical protein